MLRAGVSPHTRRLCPGSRGPHAAGLRGRGLPFACSQSCPLRGRHPHGLLLNDVGLGLRPPARAHRQTTGCHLRRPTLHALRFPTKDLRAGRVLMWERPAGLAGDRHLLKNISSEWPGQVQPVLFKAQLYALHLGKVTAERNLYWTVTAGGGTPCNSGRAVKRPIPAREAGGQWPLVLAAAPDLACSFPRLYFILPSKTYV